MALICLILISAMLLSLVLSVHLEIGPLPKSVTYGYESYGVAHLKLDCSYADGSACYQHIYDNFDFYLGLAFTRDAPYDDYSKFGVSTMRTVKLVLNNKSTNLDIRTLNESYKLKIAADMIEINADNSFGAARAFQSLAYCIVPYPEFESDGSAYITYQLEIVDEPTFKWRQLLIDPARHYLPLRIIREIIDSLSVTKQNVLHFHAVDMESFPLKLENAPQNELVKGAYSERHYYSTYDLEDLKNYAWMRGVFFMIEIDNPSHATSWGAANPEIVAHCPGVTDNIPLNPINDATYDYVIGTIEEAVKNGTTKNLDIKPLLHLGGDEMVKACWEADADIAAYMKKTGKTSNDLWLDWTQKVTDLITQKFGDNRPLTVYWEEMVYNAKAVHKDSIFHFWMSNNKESVLKQGFKVITSVDMYLPYMHPGGVGEYSYGELWWGMYENVNIYAGVADYYKDQVLGGGAAEWGEVAWGDQMVAHCFNRGSAIAEILWSNPENRNVNNANGRMYSMKCLLESAGVHAGPTNNDDPCNKPCPGALWNEM